MPAEGLKTLPQPSALPLTLLGTQPEGQSCQALFSSQLIFSEDLYFENGLQNLKASAQRSLKKLREKVDHNL